MSRVFPLREDSLSTGTRMMTGRDRSYRRAVRRSVIATGPPFVIHAHIPLRVNECNQHSKAGNIIFVNLDLSSASSFPHCDKLQ
jgi:hypothetical protein